MVRTQGLKVHVWRSLYNPRYSVTRYDDLELHNGVRLPVAMPLFQGKTKRFTLGLMIGACPVSVISAVKTTAQMVNFRVSIITGANPDSILYRPALLPRNRIVFKGDVRHGTPNSPRYLSGLGTGRHTRCIIDR